MLPVEFIEQIFPMVFQVIGGVMVLLSAIQIGLAFAKNEAHDQTKGIWLLFAGAAVLTLGVLLGSNSLGLGALVTQGDAFRHGVNFNAGGGTDGGLWNEITFNVARWIPELGIVAMVWGAFQFFESFRNDDAGQKIKGLKFLFAGALLWQILNVMRQVMGV